MGRYQRAGTRQSGLPALSRTQLASLEEDRAEIPEELERPEPVREPKDLDHEFDENGKPILFGATPFTQREAFRYANGLLDAAAVKPGDVLGVEISAWIPEQVDAARALALAAHARGCQFEVIVSESVSREKVDRLLGRDAVFMQLSSFTPPGAEERPLTAEEEAFVEAHAAPQHDADAWDAYMEAYQNNEVRWNMAVWPTRNWAKAVYPELDPDEAYRKLGQDLRYLARCADDDPEGAWREHVEALQQRADELNKFGAKKLRIKGAGTDLQIDVADGAKFAICQWETRQGSIASVNTPTEEVFTTPDPGSATGVIKATKPFVFNPGNGEPTEVVEGVWVRLEKGRVVEIGSDSDDPYHQMLLEDLFSERLQTDRIGEIGLVGQDSRVAELGRVFNNNFVDENGGLHFGFGYSYDSITGGEGHRAASHYDISCGSDQTEIWAVDASGNERKIMEGGRWLI